jgi:RES domain-containing protein
MRIWRIEKARHAADAFTGKGSARCGGRWHRRGTRVVYASESRALAALEHLLQAPHRVLRTKLVCFEARIPDELEIEVLHPGALPANWDRTPAPRALKQIGTHWIASGKSAVLRVPSAVVPGEFNFLLNPEHDDFERLEIFEPEPFELGRGP